MQHPTHGSSGLTRRGLLTQAAAGVAAAAVGAAGARPGVAGEVGEAVITNGRIHQSLCAWCYEKWLPLEQLCQQAVAMGIKSVELVEPEQWPILKKYGLICAMTPSHGFVRGFNHPENHDWCIDSVRKRVDQCAEAGFPNVITFSGFRKGMPDDQGLEHTVAGLKKVIGYAEQKKVNLVIEVLNSRVNVPMKGHPDYQCDKVEWAAEVCRRVGSERMKILFDIYHVQIMEGDVITRIREFHPYVGHYHVAGVPGRNEYDGRQELNYPPILKAILDTGYQGYVGQEFIPTDDCLTSLHAAVKMCDV